MPPWIIPAPTGPTSGSELVQLIEHLTNWFFVGFLILAVILIIIAGWQFISSRAEPQAIMQARNKLFWAVIAIVAAVLSRGVAFAISSLLGA